MLKTICYISDSKTDESLDSLKTLFQQAEENNIKNEITGILIYKNKNFLQVFEGESKVVDETFKRIVKNKKHHNIFKIIETNIDSRIFEDYNYGFTTISDKTTIRQLQEYFDWLKDADNMVANEIIALVKNFTKDID